MAVQPIVEQRIADGDLAYLRETRLPQSPPGPGEVSVVDLFSGCGGLTLGVIEGARRLGRSASLALAIDVDDKPLEVLRRALDEDQRRTVQADLGQILRPLATAITSDERNLLRIADGAEILVAGPPCQGHSALNNHTRHDDPRNDLYVAVARAAQILLPKVVIVENVRGVGRDRRKSVGRCRLALEGLGYLVSERRIDLTHLGVPQRRIRHVLIGTQQPFSWDPPSEEKRPLSWAIDDLLEAEASTPFDTPSVPSAENARRMKWLFDRNAYDLENAQRPQCHRTDHSYRSMYGRLRWDEPAQTITSGFGSMGQGRFVHPKRRRTLTPHEAARIQFLPDFLPIGEVTSRGAWARMIGNAAPPALTISVVASLIQGRVL